MCNDPETKIFATELEELWQVCVEQQQPRLSFDEINKLTGVNYMWGMNVEKMRDVTAEEILAEQVQRISLEDDQPDV